MKSKHDEIHKYSKIWANSRKKVDDSLDRFEKVERSKTYFKPVHKYFLNVKLHNCGHTTDLCVDRRKLLHQRIVCLSPKVGSFQCFFPLLFLVFSFAHYQFVVALSLSSCQKRSQKSFRSLLFFSPFFVEVIQPMMLVNDTTAKIIVQTTNN